MKKKNKDFLLISILIAPSLIIFIIYRIIPIFWNFFLSFYKFNIIGKNEWLGLKNYVTMFTDSVFWEGLRNTCIYFAAGTPVAIIISIAIALLVNERIRGRNIYRTIIFLPYPISTVAVGIIWKWLYNEKVGLFNYVLRSLKITKEAIPFLESFSWALPSVIVTSLWQIIGFFMIIILTGIQSIPSQLYEASELDGATFSKQLFGITLPLLKSSIFLCFVIGIINSFTMFDIVYVMTGGGPGHSTEILVSYIYKNAFRFNRIGYAAAITVFLFLFLLFVTFIINRISGEEAGGERYYE